MDNSRVVISGVNGFVGHHLARYFHENGFLVIGIGTDVSISASIAEYVDQYHQVNLVDTWPETGPVKAVIHLAGLAAVGPSFDNPQQYINANSAMATNLCEYYLGLDGPKPRIILVSSGAIYDGRQSMPIQESGTIGFGSPYAVSKVLNENQAAYYRGRGLDCVVARPFNHIGPGQAQGFILPDFYGRLTELEKPDGTIVVGNIETSRDYTDVRDIVRAYVALATAPTLQQTTYNICSGVSLSGAEIFNALKVAMGLPDASYSIDQALVRPTDIATITGDSSALQAELGWKPEIAIDQTIRDFVHSK